jgi:hypothetical protein
VLVFHRRKTTTGLSWTREQTKTGLAGTWQRFAGQPAKAAPRGDQRFSGRAFIALELKSVSPTQSSENPQAFCFVSAGTFTASATLYQTCYTTTNHIASLGLLSPLEEPTSRRTLLQDDPAFGLSSYLSSGPMIHPPAMQRHACSVLLLHFPSRHFVTFRCRAAMPLRRTGIGLNLHTLPSSATTAQARPTRRYCKHGFRLVSNLPMHAISNYAVKKVQ